MAGLVRGGANINELGASTRASLEKFMLGENEDEDKLEMCQLS